MRTRCILTGNRFAAYSTCMKFDITTRRQAMERGLKRFYTGRPCIAGHDAQRFVTTGGCVACNAARSQLFRSSAQKTQGSRLRGYFTYDLDPADHAAALAFCQALDLQRGRVPQSSKMPARGSEALVLPEHLAVYRDQALREAERLRASAAGEDEPYLPKP